MPSNEEARRRLLEHLDEDRPSSRHDLADSTGISAGRVSKTLTDLRRRGEVHHRGRGQWTRRPRRRA